ncbi:MAG: hypothetical protein WC824_14165 [Bacteroidota bacterium]|jgi:hypothetical protein
MTRRIFQQDETENTGVPEDLSVEGNYNVIYRRANGKPEFGDAQKVRPGDHVEYFDGGVRLGTVYAVMGHGENLRIRTCVKKFKGIISQERETVELKAFRKILRLRPDRAVIVDPDTLRRTFVSKEPDPPPPPPPPLPEVKFAPVVIPGKTENLEPKPAPKVVGPVVKKQSLVPTEPLVVPRFNSAVKPTGPARESFPITPKVQVVTKPLPKIVKFQIRAGKDQEEGGFNVIGHLDKRVIRIFVHKRETAEAIILSYKTYGDDKRVADIIREETIPKKVDPPPAPVTNETPMQKWKRLRAKKN